MDADALTALLLVRWFIGSLAVTNVIQYICC